jgi:hypothetical protein
MQVLNRNNSVINPPSFELVDFSNLLASTAVEVDSTMFEKAINDKQKIAGYVAEKSQSNMGVGPLLTPPSVKISGVENDASSLQELLAALRLAKKNNAIDSNSLLSRLAKIIGDAQTDPVELQKSWDAFKQAHDNLLKAQAEVEQVILMLIEFQKIAEPTQEDIDKMTKAANDAFTNVNVAMEELIVTVKAALVSANQGHLDLLEQVKVNQKSLGHVLLELQKHMKRSKIELIQNQSDLYRRQQEELSAALIEKAEQISESQDKQATFVEAMKYLLMGLGVILSFASGGTLGFVFGLASAALLVADLATEGQVSEKLMAPITAILVPMIEGIVTGISKAMEAIGCNKIASMIVGVIVAIATVVVTAAVSAKVLGSTVGKLVDKIVDKFVPLFEKMAAIIVDKLPFLKPIFDVISRVVNKFLSVIAEIWDWVADVVGEGVKLLMEPILKLLKPIVDLIKDLFKSVKQAFTDLMELFKKSDTAGWLDKFFDDVQKWFEPFFAKLDEFFKMITDALKAVDDFIDNTLSKWLDGGDLDKKLAKWLLELNQKYPAKTYPANKALLSTESTERLLSTEQYLSERVAWFTDSPRTQAVLTKLKELVLELPGEASQEVYLNSLKKLQSWIILMGAGAESGLTVVSTKAEQDEKNLQADSVLINTNHEIVTQQITNTTDAWAKEARVEDDFFKLVTSMVQSRYGASATMRRNMAG